MKKLAHKNLLHYGDKAGAYSSLQADYDRDSWIQLIWHMVFWICAMGGIVAAGHTEWLWLFGGIYAAERANARFTDNSNRNWAMHIIDWLDSDFAENNT